MGQFFNINGTTKSSFRIGAKGPLIDTKTITLSDVATPVISIPRIYFSDTAYINATNYTGNAATATTATNVALSASTTSTDPTNGDTYAIQAGSGTAASFTIVNAKHAASADKATSADSATNATNATNDSDGNAINTTYTKKVTSRDDNRVTRFDGKNGAIQDSTVTLDDSGNMSGLQVITFNAPTTAGQKSGFTLSGKTDSASIYYLEPTLNDDGRIRFLMTDNTNDPIEFAWKIYNDTASGEQVIYKFSGEGLTVNKLATLSTVYIAPGTTNVGTLGTASKLWNNVYATTFTGALEGNAKTATDATNATNVALSASTTSTDTTNGDTYAIQAGSGTAASFTVVNAKHAASADSATSAGSATNATNATNVNLSASTKTTNTTNGDTYSIQAGSGTAAEFTVVNSKHAASAASADKVANAITFTGLTTNPGTFDGSTARTYDLSASNISGLEDFISASSKVMRYRGLITFNDTAANATVNKTVSSITTGDAIKAGDTWIVDFSTTTPSGTTRTVEGELVEAGDMVICRSVTDGDNDTKVYAYDIIQKNLTGSLTSTGAAPSGYSTAWYVPVVSSITGTVMSMQSISSAGLAVLAASNTFTQANTFNSTITVGGSGAATFTYDSTNTKLKLDKKLDLTTADVGLVVNKIDASGTSANIILGNNITRNQIKLGTNGKKIISLDDLSISTNDTNKTGTIRYYDTDSNATSYNDYTFSLSTHTHSNLSVTKLTNEDVNTYKTMASRGIYYAAGANTCTNIPDSAKTNGFVLEVFQTNSTDNYVLQRLTDLGTQIVYTRKCNNSSWDSAWTEELTATNAQTISGVKTFTSDPVIGSTTADSAGISLKTKHDGAPTILFDRKDAADWKISDVGGELIFSTDWTTAKQAGFHTSVAFGVNSGITVNGNVSIGKSGSNYLGAFIGPLTGNASTATTLETARNITLKDADSTNSASAVSFNGSADITLNLPSTIKASLSGNATTATTATNLSGTVAKSIPYQSESGVTAYIAAPSASQVLTTTSDGSFSWINKSSLLSGYVTGPASAGADGNIAIFNGTGGKTLKDSGINIADNRIGFPLVSNSTRSAIGCLNTSDDVRDYLEIWSKSRKIYVTDVTNSDTNIHNYIFPAADGTLALTSDLTSSTYAATATTYGLVKLGSATTASQSAQTVTTATNRTYAIQKNSSGQLVVNVPWVDTNTHLIYNIVDSGEGEGTIIATGSTTYETGSDFSYILGNDTYSVNSKNTFIIGSSSYSRDLTKFKDYTSSHTGVTGVWGKTLRTSDYISTIESANTDVGKVDYFTAAWNADNSFIVGLDNLIVDAEKSNAIGKRNFISGGSSVAYSTALGNEITITAAAVFATGQSHSVSGDHVVVGGIRQSVSGSTGATFGSLNTVSGNYSFTSGYGVMNDGTSTVNIGRSTVSNPTIVSTAQSTWISNKNFQYVIGTASGVFGLDNFVSANTSFAFGQANYIISSNSAAFGLDNGISQAYDFAAGSGNSIMQPYSVAFGRDNYVTGQYSAAIGNGNKAHNSGTFAAGYGNEVYGNTAAAAIGAGLLVQSYTHDEDTDEYTNAPTGAMAIGAYNDNDANDIFEIGNGSSDSSRSNAFTVDKDGNVNAAGDIKSGGESIVVHFIDLR